MIGWRWSGTVALIWGHLLFLVKTTKFCHYFESANYVRNKWAISLPFHLSESCIWEVPIGQDVQMGNKSEFSNQFGLRDVFSAAQKIVGQAKRSSSSPLVSSIFFGITFNSNEVIQGFMKNIWSHFRFITFTVKTTTKNIHDNWANFSHSVLLLCTLKSSYTWLGH